MKNLNTYVTQGTEEAKRQRRIAPRQMVGNVDEGQRSVGRLNQARELVDQPQERSYEADAMRGDEVDRIDQGRDCFRSQEMHLLIEDLAQRCHARIELLGHHDRDIELEKVSISDLQPRVEHRLNQHEMRQLEGNGPSRRIPRHHRHLPGRVFEGQGLLANGILHRFEIIERFALDPR